MSIFKASWAFRVQLALLIPVSVGLSGCQFSEAEPGDLAELSSAASLSELHGLVPLHMEPPHWWLGFEDASWTVVLHAPGAAEWTVESLDERVGVTAVERRQHDDFLFFELTAGANALAEEVADTLWLLLDIGEAGRADGAGERKMKLPYPIRSAETMADAGRGAGVSSGVERNGTMYLIMPDRFSNGDPSNDVVAGMRETKLDRGHMYARHGGDLEGVTDRLDYLKAMGIGILWLNPVLENDQPEASYHGYAITDHYKVDPRLGRNDAYAGMVRAAHDRDMAVLQDVIFNHWGHRHWMIESLPDSSWIQQWPAFTRTNYNANVMTDPHAAASDVERFNRGWFVEVMPDLDPTDPVFSDLLIQNSLWWVAETGIDGFRVDTYPYSDQDFMARWGERVLTEFPDLFIFGECWVNSPAAQAQYTAQVQSVKDFQLQFALVDALQQDPGWRKGIGAVYNVLAQDGAYQDPGALVTFVDNHDISRWFSVAGERPDRFLFGIGLVMTTRGIPCLYYGTEIGMKNFCDPDGLVRSDFPGGWPGDPIDKFEADGRSAQEERFHAFISGLGALRSEHPAAFSGELTHFIPQSGQYHYFRHGDGDTLMILTNASDEAAMMDWNHIASWTGKHHAAHPLVDNSDVVKGDLIIGAYVKLPPWHFGVYKLD